MGNIFVPSTCLATLLHYRLIELLPVLQPRAQFVSQQISVPQVEQNLLEKVEIVSALYNMLLQLAFALSRGFATRVTRLRRARV